MALETIDIANAEIRYDAEFLSRAQADAYLACLQQSLAWRQDQIQMYGRTVPIPRLQAWYGDEGSSYRYSGLDLDPLPWTEALLELKHRIEAVSGQRFNSVLANLYRHGNDSMGWHADDEPELGENPVIASLTLGNPRQFSLKQRHKHSHHRQMTYTINLQHGSLLIMAGATQHHWLHALPKRPKIESPRINLTFRYVYPKG